MASGPQSGRVTWGGSNLEIFLAFMPRCRQRARTPLAHSLLSPRWKWGLKGKRYAWYDERCESCMAEKFPMTIRASRADDHRAIGHAVWVPRSVLNCTIRHSILYMIGLGPLSAATLMAVRLHFPYTPGYVMNSKKTQSRHDGSCIGLLRGHSSCGKLSVSPEKEPKL
jgi:hypothetical protein